ncbi:MAG: TldD/PmbA family protein [Bacteriovoracaceae bacterium]|nr:TldD/PmbA family protein [Bacteriovoracaceae bacterium]
MEIEDYLNELDLKKIQCEYCDVRIEDTTNTTIVFDDYELVNCEVKPSLGAFIRVYSQGMWYYGSTTDIFSLDREINSLIAQADHFGITSQNENLVPYNTEASVNTILEYSEKDVRKVPISKKIEFCRSYFEMVKSFEKLEGVFVRYVDHFKMKYFKSSTDVSFTYDFNQCGSVISYSILDGDKRFDDSVKSYSDSFETLAEKSAHFKSEIIEGHDFLEASTVEAGSYPVVMESSVVGVFAHESFGHKSEADFMLGDDKATEDWKIGSKIAHENLSIVDYGAEKGTSGYCPIDDEGFPTQKTYLIKDGILAGRLHSQYTSSVFNEAPTGNGRSINFEFEPIVRMTNTYVETGKKSLDELIKSVKKGIYVKDFRHGSGLSTFTIAPIKSYMIRDGKIAEPVKASVLSGSVFETLGLIEGCTTDFELLSSSFGGCGKMEQHPLLVGFGGSKVLISKMMVS